MTCNGRSSSCPDCGGTGTEDLPACPRVYAAAPEAGIPAGGAWAVVRAAERDAKGHALVAGGDGDQTVKSRALIDFAHAEEAEHKAEAMERAAKGR